MGSSDERNAASREERPYVGHGHGGSASGNFTKRLGHTRDNDALSQDGSMLDADSAKTPRGEDPPILDTAVDTSASAAASGSAAGPAIISESEATPTSHHGYFGPSRNDLASRPDTISTMSNLSSPLHSAGASSSSLQSTGGPLFPTSTSADSRELYHRLIKVQSNASVPSSSSRAPSGRQSSRSHTSNPSPSAAAASSLRARGLYEGPRYPDQSFAALHHQPFTPPYPYYRSHSPFLYHGSQTSGSPNRSQEHLVMSSPPNRTGGNTPVESPGLFSIRGRPMDEEMESSQYKLPSLHPTYHNAPKESHSLRKDRDAISGHKIINEYEVLYEIGKGTHGKVKLARSLGSGQESDRVAIKIVKRFKQKSRLGGRETQEDKVKKEIAVLKKARHHHVVRLIEVIDDPEADKVYMILEYVEEGEMKWRRKADKWVVHFERRRVERERHAWERGEIVDPDIETAEINEFNAQLQWRCQEKAHILSRQKQKAFERISSRKSSSATIFTDDEQLVLPREVANNWSLEHGNESENEVLPDQVSRRRPSRMVLQHQQPSIDELPLAISSFHYSQHHPQAARSAEHLPFRDPFASGSDPVSPIVAPPSQLSLPESVEKSKEFQRELKNIQRDDDYENFTDEDEHFRHVPCLTMTRTRECFRDTVLGLEYLHYQGIIHRDIKPANLLWTKDHRVKISDFGVSYLGRRPPSDGDDPESDADQREDDVDLARTVGTPFFFAPEICDPGSFPGGKDRRRKIGPQMDIWALGVTLYAMVFARLPFTHPNPMSLFELIAKQEVFIPARRLRAIPLNKRQGFDPKDRPEDFLDYEEVGDELRDLLRRMLHKDPEKRITIKEIKRHPWVVKGMPDPLAWLDQTDPGNYIKDKKIQVTDKDVSAAIAPLTFADRVIQLTKRVSSLVRGRDSSKRATSRSAGKSASASSRSTGPDAKSRRASMRSEDLFAMFRSSRPETAASEHPLSQSQLASPVQGEAEEGYFAQTSAPPTMGATPTQQRPTHNERSISTAESVKTIRAPKKSSSRPDLLGRHAWSGYGDLASGGMTGIGEADLASPYMPIEDAPTSHPASITGRFGGTRRTPALGPSSKRSSLSVSSKSTSSDRLSAHHEDPHTMPLVAMSSATATGRVEAPSIQVPPSSSAVVAPPHVEASAAGSLAPGRRPRAVTSPRPVSTEAFGQPINDDAFDRARLQNLRRDRDQWLRVQAEQKEGRSRPHSRSAAPEYRPMGPDDEMYWANQRMRERQHQKQAGSVSTELSASSRPSSSKRSSIQRGISATSSSDDVQAEATFSDNSRHPSMPSVVSASSINSVGGTASESERERQEQARSQAEKRVSEAKRSKDALMSTGETVTPANANSRMLLMRTAGSGEEKTLQGVIGSNAIQRVGVDDDAGNDTDAGYNSDQDYDGDSDDEGIVFGGFHR